MFRATTAFASTVLVLTGCASFNNLSNDVSTFGAWPAQRTPATFVFERLPSQEAHPERQQQLEDAARAAVEAAGFKQAASPADAEYLMQLGARVSTNDPWFYNDPFLLRSNFRYGFGWGYNRWGRSPWGLGVAYSVDGRSSYEREVAVLIRDRRSGELLYEARASNNGPSASIDYLLPAMYRAAMKDFPGIGPKPHNVTVELSKN